MECHPEGNDLVEKCLLCVCPILASTTILDNILEQAACALEHHVVVVVPYGLIAYYGKWNQVLCEQQASLQQILDDPLIVRNKHAGTALAYQSNALHVICLSTTLCFCQVCTNTSPQLTTY